MVEGGVNATRPSITVGVVCFFPTDEHKSHISLLENS